MQNLPKLDFKKQVCKYLSPGAQYYAIRIYDTIEGHQHNFNNAPKSIQLILDNSHPEYYRVLGNSCKVNNRFELSEFYSFCLS